MFLPYPRIELSRQALSMCWRTWGRRLANNVPHSQEGPHWKLIGDLWQIDTTMSVARKWEEWFIASVCREKNVRLSRAGRSVGRPHGPHGAPGAPGPLFSAPKGYTVLLYIWDVFGIDISGDYFRMLYGIRLFLSVLIVYTLVYNWNSYPSQPARPGSCLQGLVRWHKCCQTKIGIEAVGRRVFLERLGRWLMISLLVFHQFFSFIVFCLFAPPRWTTQFVALFGIPEWKTKWQ